MQHILIVFSDATSAPGDSGTVSKLLVPATTLNSFEFIRHLPINAIS